MNRVAQAVRLFVSFFERQPKKGEIVNVRAQSETCIVVGQLDGLIYRVDFQEEPFIHRFKKSDRPLLAVSSDGRQAFILMGGYRFSDRGFVG